MSFLRRAAHHSGQRLSFAGTTAALLTFAVMLGPSIAADADAGKTVFKKCAACHRLEPGRNHVGPSLHGVVGRKAGTAPRYRYSGALKDAGFTWTPERLDQWLAGPKKMLTGTKMAFPGLLKREDRANVIEYLEQSTD